MSPVQDHVQRTVAYLEQDLVSYESVANNGELKGKLGVGMITNATAALNLFGWLLYQTLDQKINDRDLFKKLITGPIFHGNRFHKREGPLRHRALRCRSPVLPEKHQYY